MHDEYAEPEAGARAAERIEQSLALGEYDDLEHAVALAARLAADLSLVVQDKHLRIVARAGPFAMGPWAVRPQISDAGVVRADRLAGNVGYLEIVGFLPPEQSKAALDRAMGALASTRALIIDLRRHLGGSRLGAAYLLSFFVDPGRPVHVIDILWRNPGTIAYRTEPTFTSPTPTTYLKKPVYLLISPRTFSGGEEFCYDMQAMKLAVLVGETTGGGANPTSSRPLGSGLSMSLPVGKARSPITRTNWEGVGVAPDIAAASETALRAALQELGEASQDTRIGDLSRMCLFHLRETPLPGSEAALRRLLDRIADGEPDYERMTPAFANAVRSQLVGTRARLGAVGPIKSVVFCGPDMAGDRFEVRFANGVEFRTLFLSADGKIAASFFRPVLAAR